MSLPHRPRLGVVAVAAIVTAAATITISPAGADQVDPASTAGSTVAAVTDACGTAEGPMAQTFASLADPNWYVPVSNGGFEHGSNGWTLTGGASVQPTNQTLLPLSPDDHHDLQLAPGASATTSPMCVAGTAPTMRLFARQTTWLPSILLVTVVAVPPGGGLPQVLATPSVTLVGGWGSPTELFRLPWVGDGATSVSITITSAGLGPAQVDDVFVDPLRQR